MLEEASLWTYPCNRLETYCISAIKAQAAGAIPVVNRHSALNETVHPDAPSLDSIDRHCDGEAYKQLLIGTMARVEAGELGASQRETYRRFAAERSWRRCTDEMLDLISALDRL